MMSLRTSTVQRMYELYSKVKVPISALKAS